MKPAKGKIGQALDRPDSAIRLYLFHGQDESQSRALGQRLLGGLAAEKFALAAQSASSDPAALADEAAAIGLFGGKRAIWVEPAGDEIAEAAEAVLQAPAVESPVIAVAGALRKTSPLVRLAEAHPLALAHVSYPPSERESATLVAQLAASEGLRLGPGIAARIAAAAGNDRGIIGQELVKIALYLSAHRDRPADVDRSVLDDIGAGSGGDWTRIGDLALSGDIAGLSSELDSVGAEAEPVTVVRALQRRLVMLAPIRARVERGQRPHDAVTSAGKSVFWKEKDLVQTLVSRWDSAALARLLDRSGKLERRLMGGDSPPGPQALAEELVTIARSAARR